jgi:hypothetical protein
MSKFEIITIEDKNVTFDISKLVSSETVMFNATEIAKQFGKKPETWIRTAETQEYIDALSRCTNMCIEDLVLIRKGGKKDIQGTWIHNELSIAFLRWLNPYFAVMCDRAIRDMINGERTRKSNRQDTRMGYKPLSDAIKASHEEPKPYHYSNEANLLNRIVFGLDAKEFRQQNEVKSVRDNATPEQLEYLALLQSFDTHLLHLELTYDERKDQLMKYYVNRKESNGKLIKLRSPMKLLTPQKIAITA